MPPSPRGAALRTRLLLPLVLLALPAAAAAPSPLGPISPETGLVLRDDVVRAYIQESSGDRIHDSVARLASQARDAQGDYARAADWMKGAAEAAGLKDVHLEALEDGPQWRATRGELWLSAPQRFKVTSYADQPMSLGMGSGAFEGQGLELVDVGEGSSDADYAGKELKGKVAFTSGIPYPVLTKAVKERGAVGVVSAYSTPPWNLRNRLDGDFPDEIGWAAVPDAMFPEGMRRPFLFMLSDRRARELRTQLKAGPVKVDVSVQAEMYRGHFDIVSGVIPGSSRANEEVVLTAHLDHYKPGADDNASGSATQLELVRTWTELIRRGVVPPPARTLRVLWVPELVGTRSWLAHHAADPVKRVANFNFDMLGASLSRMHSRYVVSYAPDWNASFVNAVAESTLDFMNRFNAVAYPARKDLHIISVTGSRDPLDGVMERYTRGSDHQLFNDHGIPAVSFTTWPDDGYHTSGDRPENVDPTQLHRAAVHGLASVTVAAWAEGEGALQVARLVSLYAVKRLAQDEFEARQALAAAPLASLPEVYRLTRADVRAAHQRERQALLSCIPLGAPEAPVQAMVKALGTAEAQALERLQSDARGRDPKVKEPRPTELERQAQRRIPRRVKGKEEAAFAEVTEKLPKEEAPRVAAVNAAIDAAIAALRARGEGELRFFEVHEAIASYADGKRSVADIRDALYAEYGYAFPVPALMDLFDVLEKGGVMTQAR
ncbi:M28 family peptidase [Aggregicoccus sp. 17bor-14]|uniref:M28 family peptidase n=1 Tax=Myxococcaceae TaxID=31 RepID=UPI00129C608E|nr:MULTISPECIES: M28 family peptidase [Myxococcaceae]MBF5041939.1 M28 family peptidase [Simulacricoccus sp. 17bor-14]MRI87720.1 M28 family peptidase [Aggregicoccus sp. 17bor-14]